MGRIADDIEQQLKDLSPKEAARVRKVFAGILDLLDEGADRKPSVIGKLIGGKMRLPRKPELVGKPRLGRKAKIKVGCKVGEAEPPPPEGITRVGTIVHSRISGMAPFYRRCLLKDVLPFWFPRCLDKEHGGYLQSLDRDGTIIDTDKSVWAQGRMAWMLLTLYNTVEKNPEWLAWGESGLKFLQEHCFDEDGRMFFSVTQEGKPIRKRRYAYSESFAAIAYAAHAKATGDEDSANRARALLQQFLDWNSDDSLMPPKYTDTRPMIGLAPRMMAISTAQELRENLGEDDFFTDTIDRNIEEIERLFCKPDLRCVMETVAPDGAILDTYDGRLLNPGHAIEAAWFIMKEGNHRQRKPLVHLGCRMLEWMWERGWDRKHGGLFHFRDVSDLPVQESSHDMKLWWPHDEAITASLMAWLLTGDKKYKLMHQQVHEWSFKTFADTEHGEWFGHVHRDGRISSSAKGDMWKSFFHHPRMLWTCWQICKDWSEAKSRTTASK